MIDKTVREYMGIVAHLVEQPDVWIKNGNLLISRAKLQEMLDKHPYRPARDKMTSWRNLGWIISDPAHMTCRVKRDGIQRRVCCINLTAYEELLMLRKLKLKEKQEEKQ